MATRISLRREQVVAASLVGSVVVLLGFASGLGINHTTSAASATPPTVGTPAPPATESPGDQPGDQSGGGGYQAAGYVGSGGQQGDNPYPATTTAVPPPVTATTTAVPTTTPPGTTTTSAATCTPGLVPQVVSTLTSGVQGLPLLGPVVAGVGLPPLVDSLLGSCPATSTTTPTPTTTR